MQMMVRTVDGKRLWSFTVDEQDLYELICTQVAWKILKKSGNPIDKVEKDTVTLAATCHSRSDEDLKAISDKFIRAVFIERKRLNLEEYQLNGKGEK